MTVDRAARPVAPQSVLVTGGARAARGVADRGAAGRGARVVAIRRDEPAASALELLGRAGGRHRPRRHLRRGAGRPRAERVRGRQRVPSRRPDAGRDGQPLPAVDVRDQHPRHLDGAGGVPRPRHSQRRSWPPRTRPTAASPSCPTARPRRCQPTFPYDVSKAAADLHRPLLLAHLRPAGGGHPLCQPLRRRRHQPLAAGARGGRRGAGRPRAGGPLRRLARARLPLRRGRGGAYLAIWRTLLAGRGAARRSTPAAGARTGSATSWQLICRLAGGGQVAPRDPRRRDPHGEIDRQWVDAHQAARADRLGAAVGPGGRACDARSSGTASTRGPWACSG